VADLTKNRFSLQPKHIINIIQIIITATTTTNFILTVIIIIIISISKNTLVLQPVFNNNLAKLVQHSSNTSMTYC